MTLRAKSFVVLALVLVSMFLVAFLNSRTFLMGGFLELERDWATGEVQQLRAAVESESENLETKASDWAAWDDTYAYIADHNEEYAASNLVPGTFSLLRLNLLALVDDGGRLVYASGYDLNHQQQTALPEGLLQHLRKGEPLVSHKGVDEGLTGILMLPAGPMLITSLPIVNSKGEGPIRGSLLMGRYLDEAKIAELSRLTRLSTSLRPFEDPGNPADFRQAGSELYDKRQAGDEGQPVVTKALSEETIAGYTILDDVFGDPALIAQVMLPRSIYHQGQHTLLYFVASLLLSFLVIAAGTTWLLHRGVLSRVSGLGRSVAAIRRRGDPSARVQVGANDEIGELALGINGMLDSLFAEKERAQVTLRSIGDAVITTDVEGRVEYLNPSAEILTGWTSEKARGRPTNEIFRLVDEGTREYLESPVELILRQGGAVVLEEQAVLSRADGKEFAIKESAAPIRNHYGEVVGSVAVFHDVTEMRRMARQMEYQASHDQVTGLINRYEFEYRLKRLLSGGRPDGQESALCYLDLDQFKVVNDTCGHLAGDHLLKDLAGVLQSRVRESDVVARLGGDEFGVVLEGCSLRRAYIIADSLRQAVHDWRFNFEDKQFQIGVSIGVVSIPDGGEITEVLRAADSACYVAKEQGGNRVHCYLPGDDAVAQHYGEMQWIQRIYRALDEDGFCLYYQPILSLNGGGEEMGEVLLRMVGPEGELISPRAFLPAAERYHLLPRIDRWVVEAAFAAMEEESAAGHRTTYAINISGQSLGDEEFLGLLLTRLSGGGIDPRRVFFELTETSVVANLPRALWFVSKLSEKGCRFALDHFGQGVRSLSRLKEMPLHFVKIDGVFVRRVAVDPVDRALVEAVNNLGHVLGFKTVAACVENEEVLSKLAEIGVDYGQGNAIGEPRPLTSRRERGQPVGERRGAPPIPWPANSVEERDEGMAV